MSDLEEVILSVCRDLSQDYPSKEDFLAICAIEKIKSRSAVYNEQLDSYLHKLEESEFYGRDLSRTALSLKSLSKLVEASYESLIRMISNHEKNIFGKKD